MNLLPSQQKALADELMSDGWRSDQFEFDLVEGRNPIIRYSANRYNVYFCITISTAKAFGIEIKPGLLIAEEQFPVTSFAEVVTTFRSWLAKLRLELRIAQANQDQSERPPDWLTAELPARQGELLAEIAAREEELNRLNRAAGLLWRTGHALEAAVHDVFASAGMNPEPTSPGWTFDLSVVVDASARLLIEVAGIDGAIAKKSVKIGQVLKATQDAEPGDRIVLVVNAFRKDPPTSRSAEILTRDALDLLTKLGAVVVSTTQLYEIWKSAQTSPEQAAISLRSIHTAPAGLWMP